MPAIMLDGNLFASQIKSEIAEEVKQLAAYGLQPGLAAILVGHNPASQTYVRNKVRTCGIAIEHVVMADKPVDVS